MATQIACNGLLKFRQLVFRVFEAKKMKCLHGCHKKDKMSGIDVDVMKRIWIGTNLDSAHTLIVISEVHRSVHCFVE